MMAGRGSYRERQQGHCHHDNGDIGAKWEGEVSSTGFAPLLWPGSLEAEGNSGMALA